MAPMIPPKFCAPNVHKTSKGFPGHGKIGVIVAFGSVVAKTGDAKKRNDIGDKNKARYLCMLISTIR